MSPNTEIAPLVPLSPALQAPPIITVPCPGPDIPPTSNPAQPNEHRKLGDIIELVHMIGGYLKVDDDYQSLTRMSAACRAYKAALSNLAEEGKKHYRMTDQWEVAYLSRGQRGLVNTVSGGVLQAFNNGQIRLCLTNRDPDSHLVALETLDSVTFVRPGLARFKEPACSTIPTASLTTLHLDSAGHFDRLRWTNAAFFPNLRRLCPLLHTFGFTSLLDEVIQLDPYTSVSGVAWREHGWMWHAYNVGIDKLSHSMLVDDKKWAITCGILFEPEVSPYTQDGKVMMTDEREVDWHMGMSITPTELSQDSLLAFAAGFASYLRRLSGRTIQVRFGIVRMESHSTCGIIIERLHESLTWLAQMAYTIAQASVGNRDRDIDTMEPLEHPVELSVTMSYPLSKDKDKVLYSVKESFSTVPDVEEWEIWRDDAALERMRPAPKRSTG